MFPTFKSHKELELTEEASKMVDEKFYHNLVNGILAMSDSLTILSHEIFS